MADSPMRTGFIKMFNGVYGFIVPDDGGKDVYFQAQTARYFDLPMLFAGDAVRFTTIERQAGKEEASRLGLIYDPASASAVAA